MKIDAENGIQIEPDQYNRKSASACVEFQNSADFQAALNLNVKSFNQ